MLPCLYKGGRDTGVTSAVIGLAALALAFSAPTLTIPQVTRTRTSVAASQNVPETALLTGKRTAYPLALAFLPCFRENNSKPGRQVGLPKAAPASTKAVRDNGVTSAVIGLAALALAFSAPTCSLPQVAPTRHSVAASQNVPETALLTGKRTAYPLALVFLPCSRENNPRPERQVRL